MQREISPFISGDTFRLNCDLIFDEFSQQFNPREVDPYNKIFVKTDYLPAFAELSKHIKFPFILITHNSDHPIPEYLSIEKREYLLSRCIWFGQNNKSSQINSIPIGFANARWPHGNPGTIFKLMPQTVEALEELFYSDKDNLLFMGFNVHTNPIRKRIANAVSMQLGIENRSIPWDQYIKELQKSAFNICPPGNGIDTHRVWESLYCGCIPIVVVNTTTDDLFEDLPVLTIKDWSELSVITLSESLSAIKRKKYRFEKLYYPYWHNLIESKKKDLVTLEQNTGRDVTSLPSYSSKTCKNVNIDHLLISKYLNYRGGVFIEAGGVDGIFQSNTYLLEKYLGWTGILIEPSPMAADLCKKNRTGIIYQCALVDDEYPSTTIKGDFTGHPMSSVDGLRLGRNPSLSVPAQTLQSILDIQDISTVDFFSLNTQGYELSVLKGIKFSHTTFKYIFIEIYKKDWEDIVSFLSSKGYRLIECITNYNSIDNPGWDGSHNSYIFEYDLENPA